MITASIVTYNHHLLDIEPVLRSLFASPVDRVYVIDHSYDIMPYLEDELNQFRDRVFTGEPELRKKVENGFLMIYMRHENNGYGGGHNVALKEAIKLGSKYHLVVNPDIWFGPRVIPALAEYMNTHDDVAQMMPKVLYPNGVIQRLAKMSSTPMNLFGRRFLPEFFIRKYNNRYELRCTEFKMNLNVPTLSGCFMFLRVKTIEKEGLFDERFFLYGEDFDMTRRLHEKYKTIYYTDVPVYHKFSRMSYHSLRLTVVHMMSMIKYFNKWGWFKDPQRKEFDRRLLKEIEQGGIKD